MKKLFLYLFLPILFTSCASIYRPIQPYKLNYNPINKKDTVEFAYQYDVLQSAGNKRLAKKEEKHDIRLVAIQITNNSEHELEIGEDILFYANGERIYILETREVYRALKQLPFVYILYAPIVLWLDLDGDEERTTIPIGLALAVGNSVTASFGNKKMAGEVFDNYLWGKKVKVGETKVGLLAFRDTKFVPLEIKVEVVDY